MNDTIAGALIGAGATLLGVVVVRVGAWWSSRTSRRTFAVALAGELQAVEDFLAKTLKDYPRDGTAPVTDAFLTHVSTSDGTGFLFASLLPRLDTLPAPVLGELSKAHARLRMAAHRASTVLSQGGSFHVSQAETDAIREDLKNLVGEFHDLAATLTRLR